MRKYFDTNDVKSSHVSYGVFVWGNLNLSSTENKIIVLIMQCHNTDYEVNDSLGNQQLSSPYVIKLKKKLVVYSEININNCIHTVYNKSYL